MVPTQRDTRLESAFRELAREWRDETRYLSSSTQITAHPAYQRIVQLGAAVVPLLLEELRREPDHWFAALRELTGENPVAPEDRGDVPAMAAAWVRWGEREHLIPPAE
jgi:hypothetical protein